MCAKHHETCEYDAKVRRRGKGKRSLEEKRKYPAGTQGAARAGVLNLQPRLRENAPPPPAARSLRALDAHRALELLAFDPSEYEHPPPLLRPVPQPAPEQVAGPSQLRRTRPRQPSTPPPEEEEEEEEETYHYSRERWG